MLQFREPESVLKELNSKEKELLLVKYKEDRWHTPIGIGYWDGWENYFVSKVSLPKNAFINKKGFMCGGYLLYLPEEDVYMKARKKEEILGLVKLKDVLEELDWKDASVEPMPKREDRKYLVKLKDDFLLVTVVSEGEEDDKPYFKAIRGLVDPEDIDYGDVSRWVCLG